METAQMLLFQQERDVLSMVLLENITEREITISLRKLLCEKNYLKCPNEYKLYQKWFVLGYVIFYEKY